MDGALMQINLDEQEFQLIRNMLYEICGINMVSGKEGLIKARLTKRVRALHLNSFEDYVHYVRNDKTGHELSIMVDALTTNKTNFFREQAHFDFLHQMVLPQVKEKNKLRFWSAACSSGEEPYSLAMQLYESVMYLDQKDVRILATDISPTVLAKARDGRYEKGSLDGVSQRRLQKFFARVKTSSAICYQVTDRLRSLVTFARLNLMDQWPMKGPFDVIFCRNVMIYFDRETRERLVNRFYHQLDSGGYLLVGHSESLSGLNHPFEYVQPATYTK